MAIKKQAINTALPFKIARCNFPSYFSLVDGLLTVIVLIAAAQGAIDKVKRMTILGYQEPMAVKIYRFQSSPPILKPPALECHKWPIEYANLAAARVIAIFQGPARVCPQG
jgi:hypothetical protein